MLKQQLSGCISQVSSWTPLPVGRSAVGQRRHDAMWSRERSGGRCPGLRCSAVGGQGRRWHESSGGRC